MKGSRDPLGGQPIWSAFGRHVVTNLTTQSTSVRGFTVLLLGRYFAADLLDRGMAAREDALNIFLRMEQIGAYVRYVAHGVEGEIRGIERVKRFVDEQRGKVVIAADRRGMILSDQKVYGLWGLYSVPARTSGLIPDGALDVTPSHPRLRRAQLHQQAEWFSAKTAEAPRSRRDTGATSASVTAMRRGSCWDGSRPNPIWRSPERHWRPARTGPGRRTRRARARRGDVRVELGVRGVAFPDGSGPEPSIGGAHLQLARRRLSSDWTSR